MNKKLIVVFAFATLMLAAQVTFAQTFSEKQLRHWHKNPEWITMMDDTNANYFEVVAAFEAFWQNRQMPEEEDAILGMSREKREDGERNADQKKFQRKLRRMEKEERQEALLRHQYAFDVKKYHHWKITVDPYVQSDGSILSPEEQLELWKNQRNNNQ